MGIGVRAATANLSVDILSFSRSNGLYGGVPAEGAAIATRGSLNVAYYGREVSPADIPTRGTASNAHAAPLIELMRKAAEAK